MKAISLMPDAHFPKVRLYADSAIMRDSSPLFVPDFGVDWVSRVCVAIRIGRLGKNISPRFAIRYVDALGMVNVLSPDTSTPIGDALDQSGCCSILDGVITTGRWITVDASNLTDIEAVVCGSNVMYKNFGANIGTMVEAISIFSTVKTGDIIICPFTAIPVRLFDNEYITASVLGQECLKLKVKM